MSVSRKSSASDIILLVFVLLVLGDLGDTQWLVLGATIGLCGCVADVVVSLVNVVRAFITIAILVHGVEEDEDAEGSGCHDAHHHARGAAAFSHHLRRTRKHLNPRQGRLGCEKGRGR